MNTTSFHVLLTIDITQKSVLNAKSDITLWMIAEDKPLVAVRIAQTTVIEL